MSRSRHHACGCYLCKPHKYGRRSDKLKPSERRACIDEDDRIDPTPDRWRVVTDEEEVKL